ncbi:hypothetical protein CHU98_g297 [Xylaria longipes]|nr:hypothetical protein CHU98_g297 [Xylaria longipes]
MPAAQTSACSTSFLPQARDACPPPPTRDATPPLQSSSPPQTRDASPRQFPIEYRCCTDPHCARRIADLDSYAQWGFKTIQFLLDQKVEDYNRTTSRTTTADAPHTPLLDMSNISKTMHQRPPKRSYEQPDTVTSPLLKKRSKADANQYVAGNSIEDPQSCLSPDQFQAQHRQHMQPAESHVPGDQYVAGNSIEDPQSYLLLDQSQAGHGQHMQAEEGGASLGQPLSSLDSSSRGLINSTSKASPALSRLPGPIGKKWTIVIKDTASVNSFYTDCFEKIQAKACTVIAKPESKYLLLCFIWCGDLEGDTMFTIPPMNTNDANNMEDLVTNTQVQHEASVKSLIADYSD